MKEILSAMIVACSNLVQAIPQGSFSSREVIKLKTECIVRVSECGNNQNSAHDILKNCAKEVR